MNSNLQSPITIACGAAVLRDSNLPGELKGILPSAKQLADIVRVEMEGGK